MGTRSSASQRTRVKVLEAAAVLFSEHGYGRTTLQAIADRAGVSVETVGNLGPKRRLLREAFDSAFAGNASAFPASGEPAYIALTASMDFSEAVSEYIRIVATSVARTAGLWQALQAAADTDPRAAALRDEFRALRHQEYQRTAQWLVDNGRADPSMVPQLIEDFYMYASHEAYILLSNECSYTSGDFGDRLARHMSLVLAAHDDRHSKRPAIDRQPFRCMQTERV